MRLQSTDIFGDIYVTQLAIGQFFLAETNEVGHLDDQELADLLNELHAQIETDDDVEDSFRDALKYDADAWAWGDEDIDFDTSWALDINLPEIMDLCDIVEAVQKGYIL